MSSPASHSLDPVDPVDPLDPAALPASPDLAGEFCLQTLPVFARQIENVRAQTENAIVELSARFRSIVASLDGAVAASQEVSGDGGQELVTAMDGGKQQLLEVVEALQLIRESRAALIAEPPRPASTTCSRTSAA